MRCSSAAVAIRLPHRRPWSAARPVTDGRGPVDALGAVGARSDDPKRVQSAAMSTRRLTNCERDRRRRVSTNAALIMSFHLPLSAARRAKDELRHTPALSTSHTRRRASAWASPPTACGASFRSISRRCGVPRGRHRRPPDRLVAAVPRFCCWSTGAWDEVGEALRNRRTLVLLTVTAVLIGGQLAALRLCRDQRAHPRRKPRLLSQPAGERPARPVRAQGAAVLAAMGRGGDRRRPGLPRWPIGALGQLWISLTLCVSFAPYGLLRKIASVDAVAGLAIETGLLFPIALGWLVWGLAVGAPIFGASATRRGAARARRGRHDDAAAAVHRPPRGASPIRRWGCSSSSPRRCSS